MSYGSDYFREAMTLNERKANNKKSLKESIEDKQQPLKEDFTEELRSDIQYELHYSIKDALDNILVNLIDDINREFPEYNLNHIDTEQYAVELSEIIMKDLFPNM